jgi:hypothetical protein
VGVIALSGGINRDGQSAVVNYRLVGTPQPNNVESYVYLSAVLERTADHRTNCIHGLTSVAPDVDEQAAQQAA